MIMRPRRTAERLQQIATGWETLAPSATFGGMTLAQFRNRVKPSLDSRDELATIHSQRTAKIDERVDADRASLDAAELVVNAVKGDPNYGPDHPILESMGYVRKSARRSGLTKKSNGNGNGAGSATAASVA